MANEQNNSESDSLTFIMDPAHLTEGEIQYELDRRKDIGTLPRDHVLQPSGRLERRLQLDIESGKGPLDWPITLNEEERKTEVETCKHETQILVTNARELCAADDLPAEDIYRLASRTTHYHWRLKRIVMEGAHPSVSEQKEATETELVTAKKFINRLLRMIPPPPPMMNFSINTSTATNSTAEEQVNSTPMRGRRTNVPPEAMRTPPRSTHTDESMAANQLRDEVEQEEERERQERDQELGIWLRRVKRIHEDLMKNYIGAGGTGRLDRLTTLLEDLVVHEGRIKHAKVSVGETDLRNKIHNVLTDINVDTCWIRDKLNTARRQAEQSNGQQTYNAHSTMRPQVYPTVNLFPHEIDAMTLNDSFAAHRVNNERAARGTTGIATDARANMAHVTFAPQENSNNLFTAPPISTRNTTYMVPPPEPRIRNPTWNDRPNARQPGAPTDNAHTLNQNQPLNNSRQWPFPTSRQEPAYQVYHPAVTPAHAPNYDIETNGQDQDEDTQHAQPMNAGQRQQYLSRILGHRRYDGTAGDSTNNKSLSLDEFISHVRQSKSSTGLSDSAILKLISAFMQGKAFNWWQTNGYQVKTLDELEVRMRTRFEGQSMDSMSQLMAFSTRMQREDEDVLDYMDDMRRRAFNIRPALTEEQIIKTVIDNANGTFKWLLASRQYESLDKLNRHLEYLAKMKITKPEEKPYVKKPWYKPRSVQAVEIESDEQTEGREEAENEDKMDSDPITAMVDAITREMNRFVTRPNRYSGPQKPTYQGAQTNAVEATASNPNGSKTDKKPHTVSCIGCGTPGVYWAKCTSCQAMANQRVSTEKPVTCFGCGAPDVFKRNCPTCQSQSNQPKNMSAAL